MALIAAPKVIRSPIQGPTYWEPRSPISEDEFTKALIALSEVPKPITSMAVIMMKNSPPKITVPIIARGTSRRGFLVSSPRVAAPSNPANDRNPKTTPRNTFGTSEPAAMVNTDRSKLWPPGALPASSRVSTAAATIRISSTVSPSTTSMNRVPPCAERVAKNHTMAKVTKANRNGVQSGALGQIFNEMNSAVMKRPAAIAV